MKSVCQLSEDNFHLNVVPHVDMFSASCLPAAFSSGAEPSHLLPGVRQTSQDASDAQLLNLIRALFSPPRPSTPRSTPV